MVLFFIKISSLQAEQNNLPFLTYKNSPENALTHSYGFIFFTSHLLV